MYLTLVFTQDAVSSPASFSGFIRIHMNLARPITIALARQSATHSTQTSSDDGGSAADEAGVKYWSFYLPHGTSKVIHVDR